MSQKIIIISSSPRRKGNSETLCLQFQKGAVENGHHVELININDYQLGFCKACDYCHQHNNQCILKDDADKIIQKMIAADVWVFASPIYFYSITAQLKTLFDRMYAREYEIRNNPKKKQAYLILTSGSPNSDDMIGAIESYRGFIKVLRQVDDLGIINGLGAFEKNDVYNHPSYRAAYLAGLGIK